MAVWGEAMVGALPPGTVDMTLALWASLDGVKTPPTSPQRQQQQKAA